MNEPVIVSFGLWDKIKRLIGRIGLLLVMVVLVLGLVAPAFAPLIRMQLLKDNVMVPYAMRRVDHDMKKIRLVLWAICVWDWIFVAWCYSRYPL